MQFDLNLNQYCYGTVPMTDAQLLLPVEISQQHLRACSSASKKLTALQLLRKPVLVKHNAYAMHDPLAPRVACTPARSSPTG